MENALQLIPFIIYFFIFRYIYIKYSNHKKELERLRENYNVALKGGNKALALNSGRLYYEALRTKFWGFVKGRLTIFDEQAINNDLKIMENSKLNMITVNNPSYLEELEKLAILKEKGILTEDEFISQKNKIFNKN